ncbi:MAG: hypothetical protein QM802_20920 [Agriterribacter sp.]
MTKTKKSSQKPAQKKSPKTSLKKWREKVEGLLEVNFKGLKKTLGDKKFEKNLRKASKAMIAGVSKKAKEQDRQKKKVSA